MKKNISIAGIALLFCLAFALTASTQQGKQKAKENQQQGNNGKGNQEKDKQSNKQKPEKNSANNDKSQKNNGIDKKNDHDKNNDKGNAGGKNKNKNSDKDYLENGKGKGNDKKGKDYYKSVYGYNWDNDNFYDRKKVRKQDKVTICHKFSGNGDDGVSINVSENAVNAHLNHGDVIGECPTFNNRRFSDVFYSNRDDYYNTLQNTQEQVYYSQSILDYALARLTGSRAELVTMRNNNRPVADIQRREQNVVQLEQNVSLLQTLIGVAVNVVANKLQ